MFNRQRHNAILELLQSFNSELLQSTQCYFAGGTAISLALNEFRESVDIDFLCASAEGYKLLRNTISNDLGQLVSKPVKYLRDVRTDQYKIYTILESNNIPVKVEIVREARINITGYFNQDLNVPVLSNEDLFAQKLLANADRGLDAFSMSRDIIDIAFMIQGWGSIPISSWEKAVSAYGEQIPNYYAKAIKMIHDEKYLNDCINKMALSNDSKEIILFNLSKSMLELKQRGIVFPENVKSPFFKNEDVLTYYQNIAPKLVAQVRSNGEINVPGVGGGQWDIKDEDPEYLAQLFAKATNKENHTEINLPRNHNIVR